jgi:hypothetical protein
MECYVDAGPIVKVRGVTPRDCVHLALAELGETARFPVTVHPPIGDAQIFVVRDGALATTLPDDEFTCEGCGETFKKGRPDDEALAECRDRFGNFANGKLAILCDDCFRNGEAIGAWSPVCALCGCTDLNPCPGGCYWLHVTDGPLNLCSRCGGC